MPVGRGNSPTSLMHRLVHKSGGVRSEATIQADVRMLLLHDDLGLADDHLDVQLEAPVGHGKRIDVEVGRTVIEVKKTLATPGAIAAATKQLAGYVKTRSEEMGQRYIGILTDGERWIAFHEVDGELVEATRHVADAAGQADLLFWLEGVLATKAAIKPTPHEIETRLGATSSSHQIDRSTIQALYQDSRHLPTVRLKRELWANLLRSALGTQFTDDDDLFLEHTLLVNSAEVIAHLVLGLNAEELSPATLLSGDQFAAAGLHGVVDRDFFDWVLEVPGGPGFITDLARRLARFDWSQVEHDVLKVLYESVIPAETRKALGEYYTPDWLASRVVTETITEPLNQSALDPSCGSGTFLFYAVRRGLEAADQAGLATTTALQTVTAQVIGIDLHPVAVALARVTYLLALGRDRLNDPTRPSLSIPVYLGDSLGWDLREDLLQMDDLVVPTEVGDQLLSGELRFPQRLLADATWFDDLVETLVDESGRAAGKPTNKLSEGTLRRLAIPTETVPVLNANFVRLKQLHEDDRNHIWSYYIRNVSRPAWLARDANRIDVLLGNPPWLSYRYMTTEMQRRFKVLAKDRQFWRDDSAGTHQDLAGLFIARAVERFLRDGGRFGFVVPNSVTDRDYWAGFRRGAFDGANVAFDPSWDLRRIRPHLFPRGSAVIFGRRHDASAAPMPADALIWRGKAPHRHSLAEASEHSLTQHPGQLTVVSDDSSTRSPYSARFAQGANLVPRLFFRVQPETAPGLGAPAGKRTIRSRRSAAEKKPWKALDALTGTVESEFIWKTLLGEHVLPYRTTPSDDFLIPLTRKGNLLDSAGTRIDAYPGLATWMRHAETLWEQHGKGRMTLAEQIDHMRKLTQQVPAGNVRVVYAASGMYVAAAVVTDPTVIVEHGLYWSSCGSEAEAHYLVGILNSPALTELARPLMSYGKDERHIDKHVWKLPIPEYDPDQNLHVQIAEASRSLAEQFAEEPLATANFVTNRRALRATLLQDETAANLNSLVRTLLEIEDDPGVIDATPDGTVVRTTAGPIPLPSFDIEIDVDCEFDHDGHVYLWGAKLSTPDGEPIPVRFGSPDADEHTITQEFATWLHDQITAASAAGRSIGWFHYHRTEPEHLTRLLTAPDTLLEHAHDLLPILRANYYSPTGYGLKTIGAAAGASWAHQGATGRTALEWIAAARNGDDTAWQDLVNYNSDDTRATHTVRAWMRKS